MIVRSQNSPPYSRRRQLALRPDLSMFVNPELVEGSKVEELQQS
jgi:hypothetical protein